VKIGIVGEGVVGSEMRRLFSDHDPLIYDPDRRYCCEKEDLEESDAVFICVPTDKLPDGSCDISIVEKTVEWLSKLNVGIIIIRSTVQPGTTEYLKEEFNVSIVMVPEYLGETVNHPMSNSKERTFLVIGGTPEDRNKALDIFKLVYSSNIKVGLCSAMEAEMTKYMENAYLATKVVFCHEFYRICKAFDIDYNIVREMWLLDPRITPSHTWADGTGYKSKCFDKDIPAIIKASEEMGYQPAFLENMVEINEKNLLLRQKAAKSSGIEGKT